MVRRYSCKMRNHAIRAVADAKAECMNERVNSNFWGRDTMVKIRLES
jgi:hypothetical protein